MDTYIRTQTQLSYKPTCNRWKIEYKPYAKLLAVCCIYISADLSFVAKCVQAYRSINKKYQDLWNE